MPRFPPIRQSFSALSLAAALTLSACAATTPPQTPGGSSGASGADTIDIQILAFNDFHGNLDPPTGSTGRVDGAPVGGVAYLAAHINRLRATTRHTVVTSAGDNIGASPLISALFHDEPTISALNALGLEFSAVGNHEFDEGWPELLRMQNGGCHPVDRCRVTTTFPGASFRYLAANVRVSATNATLFPATAMKTFDGVSVGFIGLTLVGAPTLLRPGATEGLTFQAEADAANAAAKALRAQGAAAVVALIHEGGETVADDTSPDCARMTGGLVPVLKNMSADIDVVVSGHTNRNYVCRIGGKLVTSTSSYSRFITDIDLKIDRPGRRVASSTAMNVPVTHDVAPDPAELAIIDRYRPDTAIVGGRAVGTLADTLPAAESEVGESILGYAVADAMLAMTQAADKGGAEVAFMNRGGLRADLTHSGPDKTQPQPLTYANAFSVMPFGNSWVVKTLTGDELYALLEQQFDNPRPGARVILQVSRTLTYRYNMTRPAGSRVDRVSIAINGRPLEGARAYRVTMPDFVWDGGDGFTTARAGTNPFVAGVDVDMFTAYTTSNSPLRPPATGRIRREP